MCKHLYMSLLCLAILVLFPHEVDAAHVYVEVDSNVQAEGDTFYIPIRIDAYDECVNAVSIQLSYDPNVLSVRDISTGDSIITLWTRTPTIEREDDVEVGKVYLEGGIPGGYCGRVAGDPGQTNVIAKLVVVGHSIDGSQGSTTTQVIVDPSTKVYQHDGRGTEAPLTILGAELSIREASSTPENVWLSDVKSDTIAPELFDIVFVQGPSAGNNKHYIVFNTTDKQSGIDHYEVLETDPDRFGFLTWVPKEAYWVPATSPYILRDQNLHSKILVKAVDKNGNERIASFTPNISPLEQLAEPRILLPIVLALVLVLFGIISILRFLTRRKKRVLEGGSEKESNYV